MAGQENMSTSNAALVGRLFSQSAGGGHQPVQPDPDHGPVAPNTIFIGGLPLDTTEVELQASFIVYGPLVRTIVEEGKGFGFVKFASSESFSRAIK